MSIFHPWLTREERRSRSFAERRELRRARRAGDEPAVVVRQAKLLARAEELVLDIAADTLPGHQKMDEVLDDLADGADELLTLPPGLELLDGPIIRAVVRAIFRPRVQALYDRLREDGRLPEE